MAAFGSVIQTASTAHSGWSRCYWHSAPSSGSLSVQTGAGWSWETRADVISGPFWDELRAVAAAMGEWKFYRNKRVGPRSELRQDLRLRVQSGLDVSAPVRRLFAVKKDISRKCSAGSSGTGQTGPTRSTLAYFLCRASLSGRGSSRSDAAGVVDEGPIGPPARLACRGGRVG